VGLCADRSVAMGVGLLGVMKAGGAYVPLDPSHPPERLALMVEDAQAPYILTTERFRAPFEGQHAQLLALDGDEAWALASSENPAGGAEPENLAYVIYTSGSTGQPKGVPVCHRSLINLRTALQQAVYRHHGSTPLRATV